MIHVSSELFLLSRNSLLLNKWCPWDQGHSKMLSAEAAKNTPPVHEVMLSVEDDIGLIKNIRDHIFESCYLEH